MEKDTMELKLTFNAGDVTAALNSALNEGLLCGPCTVKIQTEEEMSQSDFCPACQAAVNSLLAPVLERRMKEALVRMGLNPDWVEITKN
jgi:hypothetical protein